MAERQNSEHPLVSGRDREIFAALAKFYAPRDVTLSTALQQENRTQGATQLFEFYRQEYTPDELERQIHQMIVQEKKTFANIETDIAEYYKIRIKPVAQQLLYSHTELYKDYQTIYANDSALQREPAEAEELLEQDVLRAFTTSDVPASMLEEIQEGLNLSFESASHIVLSQFIEHALTTLGFTGHEDVNGPLEPLLDTEAQHVALAFLGHLVKRHSGNQKFTADEIYQMMLTDKEFQHVVFSHYITTLQTLHQYGIIPQEPEE